MNELCSIALIDADFPDDSQWNASGDLVVPAGRAFMESLVASLRRAGSEAAFVGQRDYYGWEAFIEHSGHRYTLLLQFVDEWILEGSAQPDIRNVVGREKSDAGLHSAMQAIDSILKADSHVRAVLWFTKREFESKDRPEGRPTP